MDAHTRTEARAQAAADAALRQAVEAMADQLCAAVDGRVDFQVRSPVADPTAEKLGLLINFLLDSGERLFQAEQRHAADLDRRVARRSALLRATFDGVLDGLIVIDADGVIRDANRAAHTLFGYADGALKKTQGQRIDARTLAQQPRWLPATLSAHRPGARHRQRPRRARPAQ